MLLGSATRLPRRGAEIASVPPAENFSPECARCAAESCRTGSRNPARSSRCGSLAVFPACVHTAPSLKTGPVAAPTAARKTAAMLAGSAHTDRPKNSLSSPPENVGNPPLSGLSSPLGLGLLFQLRLYLFTP